MLDLFKDEVYEELDDISQMIEPYEFDINNELAEVPDEIVLDGDFFYELVTNSNGSDSTYASIRSLLIKYASKNKLEALRSELDDNFYFCTKFFELVADEGITFNPATKELLGGEVKIIKKKIAYEDTEIQKIMINKMRSKIKSAFYKTSRVNKPRVNEISDLFGATEAIKDRSGLGKVNLLLDKYEELILNRKLNIRDVALFLRFVDWNIKYIMHGNLPSMSNITKVKIMMRRGLPIYSIKEEQV